MGPWGRRILAALGACAVALAILLLAGWVLVDAAFGPIALPWALSPTTQGPARPVALRDPGKLERVYVPLAYVPHSYSPSDRLLADVRWADDESHIEWERIDRARQRKRLRFVMSMAADPRGHLWVGCEDSGVWRLDPSRQGQEARRQFTTDDGLGDDHAYAVAVDRRGRVWAGHLNHGVSVYNGGKWQNYEVVGGLSRPDSLSGPLGERVFDIAVCPRDGDVWIASSCGLARYSDQRDA